MIFTINVEKAFDKTVTPSSVKTLRKLGLIGNFLELIQGIYDIFKL